MLILEDCGAVEIYQYETADLEVQVDEIGCLQQLQG